VFKWIKLVCILVLHNSHAEIVSLISLIYRGINAYTQCELVLLTSLILMCLAFFLVVTVFLASMT
jgi:hypothetical protein